MDEIDGKNEFEPNLLQEDNKSQVKTITAQLDLNEDIKLIKQYERLLSVGRFKPVEIFIEGIKVCLKKPQYLEALNDMQEDLMEESGEENSR